MNKFNRLRCLLILGLAAVGTSYASTPLTVSTHIVGSCSFGTINTMAFGSYTGTVINTTSTFSVTCTNGTNYTVTANEGTGAGASFNGRIMTGTNSSSNTLTYNLYTDAGRTKVFYDEATESTTRDYQGTGTGSSASLTIYGQIAGGLTPVGDSYTDTVTLTMTAS